MIRLGYTVGTFDLLHIGHVRLLAACRAQCDALLVGVNSDDLVVASGKPVPIIPMADRVGVLRGLRSVDGAWVEPNIDKFAAWEELGFDALFIGDDWKDTEHWRDIEKQFVGTGVEIVYIPYTVGISSTVIRELVRKPDEQNGLGT